MTKEEAWLLKEKYDGEQTAEFEHDRERLAAGEPLAYVIGFVPFLTTTVYLNSHPLIPRPETEFWTEKAIADMREVAKATPSPLRVLDLCAGSGCIGVAVAKTIQNTHVTFAEINEEHHSTILKNIRMNGIDLTRTRVIGSDIFEHVTGTYNYILTNPPYIDPQLDRTEENVRSFEPHEALYGGRGGIEIIERIVAAAPAYLSSHGTLYIEHEPEQKDSIHTLGAKYGFLVDSHNDQFGTLRYSTLQKNEDKSMA